MPNVFVKRPSGPRRRGARWASKAIRRVARNARRRRSARSQSRQSKYSVSLQAPFPQKGMRHGVSVKLPPSPVPTRHPGSNAITRPDASSVPSIGGPGAPSDLWDQATFYSNVAGALSLAYTYGPLAARAFAALRTQWRMGQASQAFRQYMAAERGRELNTLRTRARAYSRNV